MEHVHQTATTAEWFTRKGRHAVYAGGKSVPLPDPVATEGPLPTARNQAFLFLLKNSATASVIKGRFFSGASLPVCPAKKTFSGILYFFRNELGAGAKCFMSMPVGTTAIDVL